MGDAWVEGRVVNREVSLEHGHRWRVELLDPRHGEGLWLTQQELIQHLEFSRASFKLSSPARKFQELVPVRAVRAGSTIECWGRVQDDLGLSVLVLGRNSLVEGAFARELSCRLNRRRRGSARRIPTIGARAPADEVPAFPDTSFDNPKFNDQSAPLPAQPPAR